MKITNKPCKGTGKAFGYGCGIPNVDRWFGLCPQCFQEWCLHTPKGRLYVLKNSVRGNKYNSRKTEHSEYYFDSGKEANYARDLDFRKKAGEIKSWNPQHRWELYVLGKKICQYTIDFRIENSNGIIDYVEIKGAKDYAFTLRWNLVQALFSDLTKNEDARLFLNDKFVMQDFSK